MDAKLKHLEMIQGVVNRLSANSFRLKGWSVVLISGLFALAAKESNSLFVYLAYFPVAAFWGLDGYFLWQEQLFRALYDHVRVKDTDAIDFSMDTSAVAQKLSWSNAASSKTLRYFHGTLLGVVVLIMAIMLIKQQGT